ncbi:MAG: hypothetical protein FWD17_14170 [Polyangiaceae bacterium]|nr:hypothetical protein [Polyangiaceae bacterium]
MTGTMRSWVAVGTIAAALGTPTAARAQAKTAFGQKQGEFILSADRLVPLISWWRVAQDDFGPPPNAPAGSTSFSTQSQTSISFFWGSAETGAAPLEAFYAVPRVGLDYTIVPHVTVGGDIGLFFTAGTNQSQQVDLPNGSNSTASGSAGSLFVFGIAPRAGYILNLNDSFAIWLRGGFSFYTATSSTEKDPMTGNYTHNNTDQFAIDLEPTFVYTPVPHFGLTASLDGDIPVAGRRSVTNYQASGANTEASVSSSMAFVGLTLGMLGYF